jgi:hypothetical protein
VVRGKEALELKRQKTKAREEQMVLSSELLEAKMLVKKAQVGYTSKMLLVGGASSGTCFAARINTSDVSLLHYCTFAFCTIGGAG